MKKKTGFNLRTVCGEHIIVAEGKENIDFSSIISLNDSAAYLWQRIGNDEFDCETLAQWLTEEYDVDMDTAFKDSTLVVDKWKEAGIIG